MLHYCAARAAQKGKKWGRVLSIIISSIYLFGFPIWTAVSVLLLAQLLSDEWQEYV